VQKIVPLGTRSGALRLTTGHYFTPNGRSFDGRGLVPDIEVLQDLPANPKDDKVLTAAYDLLREKIVLRTRRGRAPGDPVFSAGTLRPFTASPHRLSRSQQGAATVTLPRPVRCSGLSFAAEVG
jgi:hypothetical protein